MAGQETTCEETIEKGKNETSMFTTDPVLTNNEASDVNVNVICVVSPHSLLV